MSDGIWCSVQGRGIYFTTYLPAVPRKGDILGLSSLTRGAVPVTEAVVSKVEWNMDQQSGQVHVWLTVRRVREEATSDRR